MSTGAAPVVTKKRRPSRKPPPPRPKNALPPYRAPPPPVPPIPIPTTPDMRLTVTGASSDLVDAIEHASGLENSLMENMQEIEKMKEQLRRPSVEATSVGKRGESGDDDDDDDDDDERDSLPRRRLESSPILSPSPDTARLSPHSFVENIIQGSPTEAVPKVASSKSTISKPAPTSTEELEEIRQQQSPPKKTPRPPSVPVKQKPKKKKPRPPPPSVPPPAPPPKTVWIAYYSPEHSCLYYENEATGSVQWDHPPEGDIIEDGGDDLGESSEEEGEIKENAGERKREEEEEEVVQVVAEAASTRSPQEEQKHQKQPPRHQPLPHQPSHSPSSSSFSGAYPQQQPEVSIYEKSVKQQQIAEAKREKLRRQKEAEELSHLRKPKINKASQRMVSNNTLSIAERSANMQKKKEARLAKLRKEKEKEEIAELSFKPTFATTNGKKTRRLNSSESASSADTTTSSASNFNSRMTKHQQDKELRLRLAREREMIQATRECDFKPMIAPKSKKLVEKARKKEAAKLISRIQQEAAESPTHSIEDKDTVIAALAGDVGARLTIVAKSQMHKKEQQQAEYEKKLRDTSNPTIDERSRLIRRPGDVASRLYSERHKQTAIRNQLRVNYDVESQFDKETGQSLFQPKINTKSSRIAEQRRYHDAIQQTKEKIDRGEVVNYSEDGESIVLDYDVADSLINRGREYKSKIEKQKKMDEKKVNSLAAKPKINKTSEIMASKRGTTSQRLNQSIGAVKTSTLTAIEKPTFQPRLVASEHHNDDRMRRPFYNNDGSSQRGAGIAQRNEAWLEAKADRARKAREAQKALEDAELTFQPNVKSKASSSSTVNFSRAKDSPSRVAERSQVWQNEKTKRLQQQRMLREEAEMEGHTFAPNLKKAFSHQSDPVPNPSEYRDPEDEGDDEGGYYEKREEEDDDEAYVQVNEEVAMQRDLSRKSSIFSSRPPKNQSRRRSVQEALEELDDFMALESSVVNDNTQMDISGINNTNYQYEDEEEFEDEGGYIFDSPDRQSGLPPGWLEFLTEEGKTYYHNALTGATQWEPPTVAPTATTPAPQRRIFEAECDDDFETDEQWIRG